MGVPSAVGANAGLDPKLGDERGVHVAAGERQGTNGSGNGGAGEECGGELHDGYRGCAKECRKGGPSELSCRERRAEASSLGEQGKAKDKGTPGVRERERDGSSSCQAEGNGDHSMSGAAIDFIPSVALLEPPLELCRRRRIMSRGERQA